MDDDLAAELMLASLQDATCALCGNPVDGMAGIGDNWYCHGDESPSCYEKAQAGTARWWTQAWPPFDPGVAFLLHSTQFLSKRRYS